MLEVVSVNINDLVEDDRNPRTHDKKNLAAIKASLEKFGQVEPLVVQRSTKKVIGGNGRLSVMRELGWKESHVVFVDVDNEHARAMSVALNRTGELAEWDRVALGDLTRDMIESGFDFSCMGFELDELSKLTGVFVAGDADFPASIASSNAPDTAHTFSVVLSDEQLGTVERAMSLAGAPKTGKNKRGDALTFIAEKFCGVR